MSNREKPILSIKNLHVSFKSHGKDLKVIRGITLDIQKGETFAIVGESGSGKSVFTKTFTGMLEKNGKIKQGSITLNDVEVADPKVVKERFKDSDRYNKKVAKMRERSVKGMIEKQEAEIEKEYAKKLAEIESKKSQADSEFVFAKYKAAVDKKYASKEEKISMKKAFALNKLYDKSSKIQVKRQNGTDKVTHYLSTTLYAIEHKFTESEVEEIRVLWHDSEPEYEGNRTALKAEIDALYDAYAASEERDRKQLKIILKKSKSLKHLVTSHLHTALKAMTKKAGELSVSAEGENRLIDTIYIGILNEVTDNIEVYFRVLKQLNKDKITFTRDFYDDELKKIQELKEVEYEEGKVKAADKVNASSKEDFASLVEQTNVSFKAAKEEAPEKIKNSNAKQIESSKRFLKESGLFTEEEQQMYEGYNDKDLVTIIDRQKCLEVLNIAKETLTEVLSKTQEEIIKLLDEGLELARVAKLCKVIGLNLDSDLREIAKQTSEKEKVAAESKRKLDSLSNSEKDKVRKDIIVNQSSGKIAACEVAIANIIARIKDRVRNADLDLSKEMHKLNEEIHNVEYLVSKPVLFLRKLKRIFSLHGDVGMALTRRGIINSNSATISKFSTNRQWSMIRGSHIATIFQDPMTSLNPLLSIGSQISEVLRIHHNLSRSQAKAAGIDLLKKVRIPDAENRYNDYPFQYSGGMRQRVVIAIALACRPDILICDEPTTALDVTVQAQILALIKELQKEFGFTIIFITHDLGVVAGVADRIGVMYGGQIVEYGTDEDIFYRPAHPYTWALLSSLPQLAVEGEPLTYIRGNPPSFAQEIDGDAFAPRSEYAMQIDYIIEPPMTQISETHYAKTWLLDERAPKVKKPALIRNLENRMKDTADRFLASSKGGDDNA